MDVVSFNQTTHKSILKIIPSTNTGLNSPEL